MGNPSLSPLDAIGPTSMRLSDVTASTTQDYRKSNQLSHTADIAFEKALRLPHGPDDLSSSNNPFVPDGKPNKLVPGSSELGRDAPRDEVDEALDKVADRFVALNLEMTHFKVAWGIAKRAGTDIETLLKAQ